MTNTLASPMMRFRKCVQIISFQTNMRRSRAGITDIFLARQMSIIHGV